MKRNIFCLVMLVTVLAFAMTVVGCDDDPADDNGGTVSIPETNVQVYNTDGTVYTGSGTVRLFLAEEQSKVIVVGSVTDGKLTLSLPSDADMLASIGSASTNVAMDSLRLYPTGSTSYRYLDYRGQKENKTYSVNHVYSKIDIKANQSTPGGAVYQINIKAGWAKILFVVEGQSMLFTSNLSGLPSDMKWTQRN